MTQTKAIFFFTDSQEDYLSHGFAVLCRLGEKYDQVCLIATPQIQKLAEYLGKYDAAFFPIHSIDHLKEALSHAHTNGAEYYSYSSSDIITEMLHQLQGKVAIHGIYKGNSGLTADTEAGQDEVYFQEHNKLPLHSKYRLLNRCDLLLTVLELPLYGDTYQPLQSTVETRIKLIILAGDSEHTTRKYPYAEELKNLLTEKGYEVITPSLQELSIHDLVQLVSQAELVISCDNLVAGVALKLGIPALGLLSSTSPENLEFKNYIQVQQPCSPCFKSQCSQLSRNSGCLSEIRPKNILRKVESLLNQKETQVQVTPKWPIINYSGKCIHIFCYHGLGDAIRFAVPLARSFQQNGATIILHVRDILSTLIGSQPEGISVAAVSDDFVSINGGAKGAAQLLLDSLPKADLAIGLGASFFDRELAPILQARGIPYWGGRCEKTNPYFHSSQTWIETMEVDKSRDLLFSLLGMDSLERNEVLLNPVPSREIKLPENSIGLHTVAMWPARSYKPRLELLEILKEKYDVWNFDNPPCDSLANLACHILQSKAILTVDTMVAHLCRALNTPFLMMQGPVWHHPDNIPHVINFTRTEPSPQANKDIDKESARLSLIPAQEIAAEFFAFMEEFN